MCWDDVVHNKTADGVEFLEYNERQTKHEPARMSLM